MNLYEVLIISIGLSLDVFAYAIYKGAMLSRILKKEMLKFCIVFGIWQVGAILVGRLLTDIPIISTSYVQMKHFSQGLSACIFLGIGIYMIMKSRKVEAVHEHKEDRFDYRQIIIWACITSIDAFFAGIGFGCLNTGLLLMAVEIGIITIISVIVGVYAGYRVGCGVKNKAVTLGGVLLLLGGFEVLFRYLHG